MDGYTQLYHLSLLVCLLVLPRLPSPQTSVGKNSEDVEDLVLTRVGHIPAQGLYVCLTRADGTAPDLGLQYTATYAHGHPSTHTSCSGDLTHRGAELGQFCLPPCPGVEATHLLSPVSLVVTGHDRTTREATAALVESLTFSDVAPTVLQVGRGVLEVRWIGRLGSTFKVQLWHHPHDAREEPKLNEGEADEKTSASGGMDDETLMKIRQCYHESHYNDEDDDDDDDDDNDDDDHEEDNDDFFKWMRWRRCVAFHARRTSDPRADAPPTVMHTSGPLTCLTITCLYYITDAPASGLISVVVMDVTHSFVHASHTAPTPLREWAELPVETVMITRARVEADPPPKAMTITVLDGPPGRDAASSGKMISGREAAVAESDRAEGDLQAMVINGHSHSEALKSLPGECGTPRVLGAGDVVCSVRALETLVDPEGRGPISSLLLLLASPNTAASTLLVIADVHVRVRQVGPGTVIVLWDRDTTVQEFAVSVAPAAGSTYNTVTVACDKRGSDCLVTFQGLAAGWHIAEVSYERQARVLLREPFLVVEDTLCDGCGVLVEEVAAEEEGFRYHQPPIEQPGSYLPAAG